MSATEPRYSKEEFARRGDGIYERLVLPRLTADDAGKFVVIDIESEAYEIDVDELAASDRLLVKHPDAQVWLRRVGFRYVRRFAPRVGFLNLGVSELEVAGVSRVAERFL